MGKIQLTESQYKRLKERLINNMLNEADAGSVVGTTAQGAIMGNMIVPGAGAVVGGAIGLAYGLISGSGGSYDGVKKMFDACNKTGMGKSTLNGGSLDSIAKQIYDAVDGVGTDEDAIKSALSKIPTIPDLCALKSRYAENYPGSTLFGDLDGDIDSDSEWNQYVYQPLLAAKRKTESLSKGGAISQGTKYLAKKVNQVTSDKLWYNFPCVPTNSGAKAGQMSNGSTVFTIGTNKYYNNGRMKKSDGTMGDFYCDANNKIAIGKKPSGGKVVGGGGNPKSSGGGSGGGSKPSQPQTSDFDNYI